MNGEKWPHSRGNVGKYSLTWRIWVFKTHKLQLGIKLLHQTSRKLRKFPLFHQVARLTMRWPEEKWPQGWLTRNNRKRHEAKLTLREKPKIALENWWLEFILPFLLKCCLVNFFWGRGDILDVWEIWGLQKRGMYTAHELFESILTASWGTALRDHSSRNNNP